jgi:hypothetical protein
MSRSDPACTSQIHPGDPLCYSHWRRVWSRLEAGNLAEVRANVLGAKDSAGQPWASRVAIPRPAMALCAIPKPLGAC